MLLLFHYNLLSLLVVHVLTILFLVLLVLLVFQSICSVVILLVVFSNRLILFGLSYSNLRISTRILLVRIELSLVRSCSILVLHGGKRYVYVFHLVRVCSLAVFVLLVFLLSLIILSLYKP